MSAITQDDIDSAVLAGRITPAIREAQYATAAKRRKAWRAAQLAAFADKVYAASEPEHDAIEDARTNARLDAAADRDCDDSANWEERNQ